MYFVVGDDDFCSKLSLILSNRKVDLEVAERARSFSIATHTPTAATATEPTTSGGVVNVAFSADFVVSFTITLEAPSGEGMHRRLFPPPSWLRRAHSNRTGWWQGTLRPSGSLSGRNWRMRMTARTIATLGCARGFSRSTNLSRCAHPLSTYCRCDDRMPSYFCAHVWANFGACCSQRSGRNRSVDWSPR